MSYKNLILWFGPAVALILVWVGVVYTPITLQAKKGEKNLGVVMQEKKNLETSIMTLTQTAQAQTTARKSYDEFLNQAPTVNRMGDFMAGVVQSAKLKGMSLDRLNGQYGSMDVSQKNIVHPVFELGLKGGFLNMGRLLEELSGKTAYRGIRAARITYDEKEYPTLTGRFVIEFTALKERTIESK